MSTASNRSRSGIVHSFALITLLLAVAATSACGTELTPKIVHVSGHAVEVVEAGPASRATVVFESGFGDDWAPWDDVASQVAVDARVFAYSRPGYGDSDPSSGPRDASHIVQDLRSLLAARGFAPPYVLVGHSFGGTYMELFARTYPEEVAGLVLVDSRHPGFSAACAEAMVPGCTIPDSVVSSLPQVQIAEFTGFASAADELRAAGSLGSYPVRVLTGTSHDGFVPWAEAQWQSMAAALADEAMDGEKIAFAGAGHYLQLERTDEVSALILKLVDAR